MPKLRVLSGKGACEIMAQHGGETAVRGQLRSMFLEMFDISGTNLTSNQRAIRQCISELTQEQKAAARQELLQRFDEIVQLF